MHAMPFPDNSIKFVFARGLVNKSCDVRLFMREVLRVLDKSGFLIIDTPIYRDALNVLGPTDVKSTSHMLRLLRGRVGRIIYSDELDGCEKHLYTRSNERLARFFIQLSSSPVASPKIEKFPEKMFEFCNSWRLEKIRKRAERDAG